MGRLFGVLALIFIFWVGPTRAESLLGYNDWQLVGHMNNSGGMFDGNSELASNYNYGTFVANPTASTADFYRAFPITAPDMRILFITGNRNIWGMADYEDLLSLVNVRQGITSANLYFDISINGVTSSGLGNVLSRAGAPEDPWVSIQGSHFDGINNSLIVWGESNYSAGTHQNLKNNNGGIDVFIRAVPEPSSASLLAFGFVVLAKSKPLPQPSLSLPQPLLAWAGFSLRSKFRKSLGALGSV